MKINNYAWTKVSWLLFMVAALLLTLISVSVFGSELPFAQRGKYGKYRTKQAHYVFAGRDNKSAFPFAPEKKGKHKTKKNKRDKNKECWAYRQWGRN